MSMHPSLKVRTLKKKGKNTRICLGQVLASERKRINKGIKIEELFREAQKQGITVLQLRVQKHKEAERAARDFSAEVYTPPYRHFSRLSLW